MEIIPAIDLKGGRVVRLIQGDPSRETRYSDDPAAVAGEWERRGAQRLHLVDLDGAFEGSPVNQKALGQIFRAIRVPAQLGGGLRSLDSVRAALDLGASVAIVGTAAIRDGRFLEAVCAAFPGRVALGLDARGGRLATSGWAEATTLRARELARGRGIPCRERAVHPEELAEATEAFLTSSLLEVMPLTRVEGRPVGSGEAGELSLRLLASYRERVETETSP